LKKILDFIQTYLLTISGWASSFAVIFIVIFLFKEGVSIFSKSPIEDGYVIAINKSNSVKNLSALNCKHIFDRDTTNWLAYGGNDAEIEIFTVEDINSFYSDSILGSNMENLPFCLNDHIKNTPNVISYFPKSYLAKDFDGRIMSIENINPKTFLTTANWLPTSQPVGQFGVFALIIGTLLVSVGAILIALPFGLATAIFMAEVIHESFRNTIKPIIELLAGIPSVVYGFFGLVVIVPLVQKVFNLPVGETGLSGSIVLAIMALPTIITIAEDAIRAVPKSMKEASLALGATKFQTIYKVILPYASSGITTAAILGIGRAIGETMAVLMVTGNATQLTFSLLKPIRTIPATIAAELGEAPYHGTHFKALFALGCVLFIITLVINIYVDYLSNKRKRKLG
jgi:phosphate transport system permease protein